jgi:ABC-type glycerol-3-phosphate transport system permease component
MPIISSYSKSRTTRLARVLVYTLATIWMVGMLVPFYYTMVEATADRSAQNEVPPRLTFRLAKVAYVSLDMTNFVKAQLAKPGVNLEEAIKGEIAVAATRPLYLEASLEAVHVIASVNGKVIAEGEVPEWNLTKYNTQWINMGPDRARTDADLVFTYFNIKYYPDVLTGKTPGVSAPWYSTPKVGSLDETLTNDIKQDGAITSNYSVSIQGSVAHMFDGFLMAIGPKELWSNFGQGSVPRWFFNSMVYALGVILMQLSISALAAYALSRLWPRKTAYWLELFFLATMMLPEILLFLPLVLMMQNFPFPTVPFTSLKLPGVNLMNTYWAMILPHAAWAFSILLFRGFFDQLPDELFQAARMDGANELQIFGTIALPLSGPIYATMTIFTFMAIWTDFLWPYLVTNKSVMWTLSIGLFTQSGAGGATGGDPRVSMSMALISAIPPLFIFLFFQRYLVKGIAYTGLKG